MKKIVHYIAGPYLKTGENWIYTQLKYLEDCKTTMYCHTTENLDQFPIENLRCLLGNESTRKLPDCLRRAWGGSFGLFPQFAFYLLKDKPDLVHAHYGPAGYDLLRLKAMFKFPMITTFYDHDATALPAQHPEWLERYRMLFQQGECFLVEGHNMVGKLLDLGCPEDKIRVHRLGVNIDDIEYFPRSCKEDEEIRVLISGRFTEKKGIPYAIEAFSRVQQRNPQLKMRLTIIGDAQNTPAMQKEKEKILSAIRAGDIQVDLHGYRPHSFLISELCRHHIFLLPSVTAEDGDIEGGAPVAIIEASASGMPVLSTWHCDIPEVIIDGESGFLVPERDVASLAMKLEEMVLNPGQWLEMGKRGRKHIEKEFNSKKQAEKLGGIYDTYIAHEAGQKRSMLKAR